MFDGIYIESEMIFSIRLALSTKWERLMYDFHHHVQYFHFHLQGRNFLYFSLRMIFLDESLNLKSVKSYFTRMYHTRWRMKNYDTEQLWFSYYKPSKVKNCHVTACFSVVSKVFWKQIPMPFKCNDEKTN